MADLLLNGDDVVDDLLGLGAEDDTDHSRKRIYGTEAIEHLLIHHALHLTLPRLRAVHIAPQEDMDEEILHGWTRQLHLASRDPPNGARDAGPRDARCRPRAAPQRA